MVTFWAASPPRASGVSDFFFFFFPRPGGHGDFGVAVADAELVGTKTAAFGVAPPVETDVMPPPVTALVEGLGVLAAPGSGVVETLVGGEDAGGVVVVDGVTEGDPDVDGLLLEADGDVLTEMVGVGVALPVLEFPSALHAEDAGDVTGRTPGGPGAVTPGPGNCVAPPFSPEAPAFPLELVGWVQGKIVKAEPLEEMARGSVMIAKAPAATTKIAVPMATIGRSQPKRGPGWPGSTSAGRKRSMTDQKASRAERMMGAAHATIRVAASEDQATADANESSGGVPSRALIRSRPSGAGSMDSAAACSARRSTSS
jgi:hypothetical protein